jgi:hypothetical protein
MAGIDNVHNGDSWDGKLVMGHVIRTFDLFEASANDRRTYLLHGSYATVIE